MNYQILIINYKCSFIKFIYFISKFSFYEISFYFNISFNFYYLVLIY